jgi:uncharacterized protein DUF4242
VNQFLVEVFSPNLCAGDLAAIEGRARAAADRVSEAQDEVRYVRAIYVPEDETCFYIFRAPSADLVKEASALAGFRDGRIVEAHEGRAS